MKTKVYSLRGLAAGQLETNYLGVPVTLNFRNGMSAYGNNKAILITSEEFIQDAIEADSRYGSIIGLESEYENEVQAQNEYQVEANNAAQNIIDSNARVQRHVEAAKLAKQEREEKLQRIREANKKEAEARAEAEKAEKTSKKSKKSSKKQVVETMEFANVNEAITYFLDHNEEVTEENLQDLLTKYHASIKTSD